MVISMFKKIEGLAAYYKIIEHEAEVVRQLYKLYTEDGFSIAGIVRWLNENDIPFVHLNFAQALSKRT